MFKTIVVPIDVDNPDPGKAMLNKVKAFASEGSKITLTNVIEDVPGLITEGLPDGLVAEVAHKARSILADMADEAQLKADVEIRSGRPHHAIVGLANEIEADLIIIGSHIPGIRDYFLGSTAAGVVRQGKCSVLVMR